MKALALVSLFMSLSPLAHAETIESAKTPVEIARVSILKTLVSKPPSEKAALQVNVVVQDLGGSTDVSPTQIVYLTLYSKGEMFSTDATFKIANVLEFKSARRLEGGVYEVSALGLDSNYSIKNMVYTIDAKKAVTEIQAVNCGSDFDCNASTNFKSTVEVSQK